MVGEGRRPKCRIIVLGYLDFPQQLVYALVKARLDEVRFGTQPLQQAERMELAILVFGVLTHENKMRTLGAGVKRPEDVQRRQRQCG